MCTNRFNTENSAFCRNNIGLLVCFLSFAQETVIIFLYCTHGLVFIVEAYCVFVTCDINIYR